MSGSMIARNVLANASDLRSDLTVTLGSSTVRARSIASSTGWTSGGESGEAAARRFFFYLILSEHPCYHAIQGS